MAAKVNLNISPTKIMNWVFDKSTKALENRKNKKDDKATDTKPDFQKEVIERLEYLEIAAGTFARKAEDLEAQIKTLKFMRNVKDEPKVGE